MTQARIRCYLNKATSYEYLTKREAELCQWLGDYTCREIGEIMKLNKRTVEYYVNNIRQKLLCENKRSLVRLLKGKGY